VASKLALLDGEKLKVFDLHLKEPPASGMVLFFHRDVMAMQRMFFWEI
jgi:hypothetical protein